jgi:ribose transport system ATP-binding protein
VETAHSNDDDLAHDVAHDLALRVRGIGKTFPGTRALDGVSLDVRRGEIHALVGTNGSGKSTLIKILAGIYRADPGGEIWIHGTRFSPGELTPAKAKASGLHFVHQIPAVFPMLSVAENIAIGHGFVTGRGGRIRWAEQRERTARILERFHIHGTPDMPAGLLGPADRTLVVIARALQDLEGERGGVLVLDEPTASLPGPEVERLLDTLRKYAAQGQAILYVTHRLDEVLRATHRITALRDGQNAGTVDTSDMDKSKIVSLMLGRAFDHERSHAIAAASTDPVLTVRGLAGGAVAGATFDVNRHEIVGIAGLIGSGAADVQRLLFGTLAATAGDVTLEGKPFRPAGPDAAIAAGVAYVPPDRARDAEFPAMSLRANLTAGAVGRYFRGRRLRHDVERSDARVLIERFLIQASSTEQTQSTLSGGNQQKAVLARCLRDGPTLLLLDEPTQGVDVHARAEIHRLLREAAQGKTAILVVSSDFEELASLCDRVVAMVRGRIVGEVRPPKLDSRELTALAHFASEAHS